MAQRTGSETGSCPGSVMGGGGLNQWELIPSLHGSGPLLPTRHREDTVVERRAMQPLSRLNWFEAAAAAALFATAGSLASRAAASDHLDAPSLIADPRADIGDVYAWMSPDAHRLNLVMTIVGRELSDHLAYVFHIDSAPAPFGRKASLTLTCTSNGPEFSCFTTDRVVTGRIGDETGATTRDGAIRAFAGRRDDPFFNNVRGTRDMYDAATAAVAAGAPYDPAGCPHFTTEVASDLLRRWRKTDGEPARNFLKGWTPVSIVISIEKRLATKGGPLVAVWGTTNDTKRQIDRAARPLTGNALLATIGSERERNALKEKWNGAAPADGKSFVAEIAKGIGLYDGFDGRCGNSLLASNQGDTPKRYYPLARLLADDRLWVDSRYGRCTALFAVERAALAHGAKSARDCGGRAPTYDASNVYRSLLVAGKPTGVDDGLHRDELHPSDTTFPFLAPVQE